MLVTEKRRRWTTTELTQVKQLLEQGLTYRHIARHLNRTARGVEMFVLRNHLNPEDNGHTIWTHQEILTLKELIKQNLHDKEIAQILNRTVPAIQNAVARLELTNIRKKSGNFSGKPWLNPEIIKLRNLYNEGKTISEIAAILNRTHSSVCNCIRRNQLSSKTELSKYNANNFKHPINTPKKVVDNAPNPW